jgi:hypothetical protein
MSQREFDHVSFRVRSKTMTVLKTEADRLGVSVNSLVNQVLSNYALFNRIVEHMEAVPLNKALFTAMLDAIEMSEMERIGKELGPTIVKSTFRFLGLDFDLDSLIEHYFQPVSMFSRWYVFNVAGSGSNRTLMFAHPYGPKWSAFLKTYLAGIVNAATGSEPRITVEDGLVTVFC